jgi:hypothetical protein
MKIHIRIVLLASILAVFVWLGFLSSAQQLPTAKVIPPTTDDLPLFLNNEQMGSVANSQSLVSRLHALHDKLDFNTNTADGGVPNIGRLIFVPDERLSMAQFGDVWEKISEFFDYPVYARMAIWNGQTCTQNSGLPIESKGPIFILSNSKFSTQEIETIKANERCWLHAEVTVLGPVYASSLRRLKSYRTALTSIELTDHGTFLLNERVQDPKLRASPVANLENPSLRRKVDLAPVKQRPIEPSLMQKEVDAWVKLRADEGPDGYVQEGDRSVELPIIVAGQVSYGSFAPILSFLGNQKVKLTIVVNNTSSGGAIKPK